MNAPLAVISGNGDSRRTLVVVFLRGGADGLGLVAPLEDDNYYKARPRIGIPKKEAVPLDGFFGLHSEMSEFGRLFAEGDLTIVHGAGSEDKTRSHFEAQDLMEHGGVAAGGWLGRYLRVRPPAASGALACVAVGRALPECLLGAPSVTVMQTLDDFSLGGKAPGFRAGLERLYAMERGPLAQAASDTFDALQRIDAMRTTPYQAENGAAYGTDGFSQGLRQLARLIKADIGLEAASIDLDGWDSHFTQQTLLPALARQLTNGVSSFRRDLGARMETTTVVVMTEFGRRVRENSAFGTDHGRGSVMFVLGGGTKGGRVIGPWPGLSDDLLEGPGDLPVIHNYRNVLAPILQRHGARESDLAAVFPDFTITPLPLFSDSAA
jgi:uncharacterized protein (DUF1501 family)